MKMGVKTVVGAGIVALGATLLSAAYFQPWFKETETGGSLAVAVEANDAREALRDVLSSDQGERGSKKAPGGGCTARLQGLDGTVGPCADYETLLRRLARLNYRFTLPTRMLVGAGSEASFVLLPDVHESGFVGTEQATNAAARSGDIPVSRFMTARLNGVEFDISPFGEAKKVVTRLTGATWGWEVKPKAPGERTLTLEVAVNFSVSGGRTDEVVIPVRREVVRVEADRLNVFKSWVSDFGSLWGGLAGIGGAVTGIFGWYRARRKKAAGPVGSN